MTWCSRRVTAWPWLCRTSSASHRAPGEHSELSLPLQAWGASTGLTPPSASRHSAALRQLLASMMTVDPQHRLHIPPLLSQLEALQPQGPGQHTTQI